MKNQIYGIAASTVLALCIVFFALTSFSPVSIPFFGIVFILLMIVLALWGVSSLFVLFIRYRFAKNFVLEKAFPTSLWNGLIIAIALTVLFFFRHLLF
jgi:hypothetical protein